MLVRPQEPPQVQAAYIGIYQFFDRNELHHAIKYMESALQAAAGNRHWKKEAPIYLLHFIELLTGLCSAAIQLHYDHAVRNDAIVALPPDSNEPDTSQAIHFVNRRFANTVWQNFPRHLNSKQYHDPYRVLKQFANTYSETEWKTRLDELREYAFSDHSIIDVWEAGKLLRIRKRLLQLIEACHLLDIRTQGGGTVNGQS